MSQANYLQIVHPWLKHEHLPVYEWVFPVDATNEELEAFIEAREQWAKLAHYPVAWVVGLSNIQAATATQRRMFASHLKRFEDHDIRWNAGSALVVPSALARGIATAVFWMTPPKFPHQAFARRADALAWARSQLSTKTTLCSLPEATATPRRVKR